MKSFKFSFRLMVLLAVYKAYSVIQRKSGGATLLSNRHVLAAAFTIPKPIRFGRFETLNHQQNHVPLIKSSSSSSSRLYSIRTNSDFDIQQYFKFPLDNWQLQAGEEIIKGHNVITCAPTGAGKTVVGEIALHHAFANNKDSIYTTPLKALSNQKFMELRKIFGVENVGLSTGDMSINRGAKVMVMTTEVYRNMAWRSSSSVPMEEKENDDEFENDDNELSNLSVVVLDEFHYMGQPGRGGVWEECVITSPNHTQIVGLSATLPNANDISNWMTSVTKPTTLVEAMGGRPVPLRYMFATRDGLEYLFKDENAGPGAPKGLLGLRGVDLPSSSSSNKKKKVKKNNWDDDNNENIIENSNIMPKGLALNPRLKSMMQRRAEKINRVIARKSLRTEFNKSDYRDYRDRSRNQNGDKRRTMSAREEQRERDKLLKSEMRKAVPSLHFLLRKLDQKSLLPAIFFIFSRAGCDTAAESVCQNMRKESEVLSKSDIRKSLNNLDDENDGNSVQGKRKSRRRGDNERRQQQAMEKELNLMQDNDGRTFRTNSNYISEDTFSSIFDDAEISDEKDVNPLEVENYKEYADRGLLTLVQVRDVAARVKAFNVENEEIKFNDNVIDQMLHGVGAHHAGQLPAHKAFVEALFRAQLMKIVFATETLAAGINMPARTTVICSMAKRGDGSSMNLLETSNMLQMAGRAGRRGMDTDGTCVVVATPFEGPNEAIDIITSEIKPVQSQFSPSYSLAVNLIARGDGKLDVAQKLVRKSFAMWGKEQAEQRMKSVKDAHGDQYEEVIETAAHVQFLEKLKQLLEVKYEKGPNIRIEKVLEVLDNKNVLKKASKSFAGLNQILELEQNTLNYLRQEAASTDSFDAIQDGDGLQELLSEDEMNIENEIEAQKKRIENAKDELSEHVMTAMTIFANDMISNPQPECDELRAAFLFARQNVQDPESMSTNISTIELCQYCKSAVQTSRKRRKQESKSKEVGFDESALLSQLNSIDVGDDSWEDMLALVNVLHSFGCVVKSNESDDWLSQEYKMTIAGDNVASLGLDNSLWLLVAMGGAWDVKGESAKLDEFKMVLKEFESFDDVDDSSEGYVDNGDSDEERTNKNNDKFPLPQQEASTLISLLRTLEPSEMAGYVSCLVADGFRGGNGSAITYFQNLSSTQQRVIQSSLNSLERLMEVQNKFSVDESSSKVQLELGTCEVVTAWAAGCSWNEALEISGLAAGDLVRTLHRALDALRQLGNLSINAARSLDGETVQMESPGIHPDIRRLCRDAARAMDRYPVKDPLPFDEEEDSEDDNEDGEADETEIIDEFIDTVDNISDQ